MKKSILVVLVMACASFAGVITLPQDSWLNFTTGKDTTQANVYYPWVYPDSGYVVRCSTSVKPGYDFYWHYFEDCVCMCACCPFMGITAPDPFYLSKKPMNAYNFLDTMLLHDTTKFTRCTMGPKYNCMNIDCQSQTTRDSLVAKLFVFKRVVGLYPPFTTLAKIQTIYSRSFPENGCTSTYLDSITLEYDIPTQTAQTLKPFSAVLKAVHNRILTVLGRSVHSQTMPGVYISGDKETVQIGKQQ